MRFRVRLAALASMTIGSLGLLGPAVAQQSEPYGVTNPPAEPPSLAQPPASQADPRQATVLLITSVEVIHSARPTPLDIIRVRGLTPTSGWNEPSLKPLTQGVPPDGILDMVFVADAPPAATAPLGFSPIAILFPLQPGHPFKGIRVRGRDNAVTVTAMPGYAETNQKFVDCSKCLGKVFVATGAQPPAGVAATDIVRQEELPKAIRIVKPTDGIRAADTDPDRLTLVLGDDGRIVDVAWD
jgi:hypothetical protein